MLILTNTQNYMLDIHNLRCFDNIILSTVTYNYHHQILLLLLTHLMTIKTVFDFFILGIYNIVIM